MHEILSVAGDALQATVFAASKALGTLQEDCTSKSGGLIRGSFDHSSAFGNNAEDHIISTTAMTQSVLLQPLGVDNDDDVDDGSFISRTIRLLSSGSNTLADRVVQSYPSGAEAEAQMYHIMWTAWSTIFALCGTISFCIWLAILLSKKANKSPFNVSCCCYCYWETFFLFGCVCILKNLDAIDFNSLTCRLFI
jgi:hypothetical protein